MEERDSTKHSSNIKNSLILQKNTVDSRMHSYYINPYTPYFMNHLRYLNSNVTLQEQLSKHTH